MQTDKQIRRIFRNRKKTLKRAGFFRKAVFIAMTLFLFCLLNPPGTLSFFTEKQTLRSSLKVTTEIENITASFLFGGNRDEQTEASLQEQIKGKREGQTEDYRKVQIFVLNKPEYINVGLEFGRAYNAENVDIRSLVAHSEGKGLPVAKVSFMERTLLLSFDHQLLKSLLGHGSHTVSIEGMFKNGWTKFSAEGTLEVVDEDVVAEQEAIKLVESLEADPYTWYQAKIDAVKKVVEGLREGAVRDDLLRRIQNIEEKLARIINEMNERKLFEEAEKALSTAEETRKKENVETARGLISKLPDGEQKESMEKRLESIKIIVEENSGKPSVTEEVYKSVNKSVYKSPDDVSVLHDDINGLLQEPEPVIHMHDNNSEKVSD